MQQSSPVFFRNSLNNHHSLNAPATQSPGITLSLSISLFFLSQFVFMTVYQRRASTTSCLTCKSSSSSSSSPLCSSSSLFIFCPPFLLAAASQFSQLFHIHIQLHNSLLYLPHHHHHCHYHHPRYPHLSLSNSL